MNSDLAVRAHALRAPDLRVRTPTPRIHEEVRVPVAPLRGPDEVLVRIQTSSDVVTARQQGRALAWRLGFSNSNLTIIATAISEISRNIVVFAKDGEVRMSLVERSAGRGVRIVATDHGPGIPDIATAMRDGYSTGQGLGIGLPGSRRLMDDFEIESTVGKGTTVTMTKWVA